MKRIYYVSISAVVTALALYSSFQVGSNKMKPTEYDEFEKSNFSAVDTATPFTKDTSSSTSVRATIGSLGHKEVDISLDEKYNVLDELFSRPLKSPELIGRIESLLKDKSVQEGTFASIIGDSHVPQTREVIKKRFSSLTRLYQMLQSNDHQIQSTAQDFVEQFIQDSSIETEGNQRFKQHVIGDKIEVLVALKKLNEPLFEKLMSEISSSHIKHHIYISENFDRLSLLL